MICTVVGAAFSSVLKARCRQLRGVISLIDDMSAKIRYRAVPLPELMTELSDTGAHRDSVFLKRVCAFMKQGRTVQEAWTETARTVPFLAESDRDILADTGARLGDSDTGGQLSMLALTGDMLSRSLEEAEEDCTRRAGALLKVWVLCGIGAGIVII